MILEVPEGPPREPHLDEPTGRRTECRCGCNRLIPPRNSAFVSLSHYRRWQREVGGPQMGRRSVETGQTKAAHDRAIAAIRAKTPPCPCGCGLKPPPKRTYYNAEHYRADLAKRGCLPRKRKGTHRAGWGDSPPGRLCLCGCGEPVAGRRVVVNPTHYSRYRWHEQKKTRMRVKDRPRDSRGWFLPNPPVSASGPPPSP